MRLVKSDWDEYADCAECCRAKFPKNLSTRKDGVLKLLSKADVSDEFAEKIYQKMEKRGLSMSVILGTKMAVGSIIEVVGAIIKDGDRYLVGQRAANKSQGGLWEFIGGKIEPGETPERALARECREELDLEIENEHIIDSVIHKYPEKTIRLTLISCSPTAGSTPKALEHQQIRWVSREEMDDMDFAPADGELINRLFIRI